MGLLLPKNFSYLEISRKTPMYHRLRLISLFPRWPQNCPYKLVLGCFDGWSGNKLSVSLRFKLLVEPCSGSGRDGCSVPASLPKLVGWLCWGGLDAECWAKFIIGRSGEIRPKRCWGAGIQGGRGAIGTKREGCLAAGWCGALASGCGRLDSGHLASGSAKAISLGWGHLPWGSPKDTITGAAVTSAKA